MNLAMITKSSAYRTTRALAHLEGPRTLWNSLSNQ